MQDVEPRVKKPQRRELPWMKEDRDTPAALGDLLTTAAPAPVAEPAAAELVQARPLPLPTLYPNHACIHRSCCHSDALFSTGAS